MTWISQKDFPPLAKFARANAEASKHFIGFTRHDAQIIRFLAEESSHPETKRQGFALADRIEALLPPSSEDSP